MPRDWKRRYNRRLQRAASERGKRMAKRRWQIFHEKRDRLAETDPIQVGGRIVERIVRIINEREVKEATFFEFDRPCDWRRKKRSLFAIH